MKERTWENYLHRLKSGDRLALAQILTEIESNSDNTEIISYIFRNFKSPCPIVGITGFPGAGKSSLIKEVIDLSSNNIELSISATTREPRDKEIHGKDYFFISDEEFNNLKDNDAFIEDATVHGYQYGTLKSFVDEKLVNASLDIILILLLSISFKNKEYFL